MDYPVGLAIGPENRIYVADTANNRIEIFNADGTFRSTFGSTGSGDGQFSYPSGISVDPAGTMLVVDDENHRMQLFAADGTFLRSFGSYGNYDPLDDVNLEPGTGNYIGQAATLTGLNYPTRTALLPGTRLNDPTDATGRVALVDSSNHRVIVLNSMLTPLFAFGVHGVDGNALGELEYPWGVGMDNQFIYVTDPQNHRVQIFTLAGQPVSAFGSIGVENSADDLDSPFDVQPDGHGHLMVVDTARSIVLFLTKDPAADTSTRCSNVDGALAAGRCAIIATDGTVYDALVIGGFTPSGNELGKFSHPQAVAMDALGRLVVLDTDGHRFLVFRAAQLTVSSVSVAPAGTWQSGQTTTVNVTVTNDGAAALMVSPQVSANLGGTITLPPAAFMNPGDTLTFPVTYLTDAIGAVTFTASASGQATVGRTIVSSTVTAGPITVRAAARPKLSVAVSATPSRVGVGRPLLVQVTATNTGNVPLTGLTPIVEVTPAGLVSAPVLAAAKTGPLALGASRVYSFTYTTLTTGLAGFAARVTSAEANSPPATASATIDTDVQAPRTTVVSVTPNPAPSGWYLAPVHVTLAATDATGVAAINYSVTAVVGFSGRTPGSTAVVDLTRDGGATLTFFAEDAAHNVEAPQSVHYDIDFTPPAISRGGVNPAPNAAGWFNQYPTVRFNASDGGSGVAFVTAPVQVRRDGAGQLVRGIARDVAGNTAQTDVRVSVDTKAPSLNCAPTVAPNALGWHTGAAPVTVTCTAADQPGLSGMLSVVVTCPTTSGTGVTGASCSILAEGVHTVLAEAKDVAGNLTTRTVTIKIDRTPPTVVCGTASGGEIWPPNHKMVQWNTSLLVTDLISGSAGFKLVAYSSSEAANALGDGNTGVDMTGWVLGTPDTSGFVRAERSGRGTGRLYRLQYVGTDQAGNLATCTNVLIGVPHDQGK